MELDNFKYNLLNLKKCDQFWDDMKPVPGGRHCESCSKTIVDFSQMTYSEIALFMSESKNPVCGFYSPDQLSGRCNQISSLPLRIGLSTLLTTAFVSYGYSRIQQDTMEATFESSKSRKVKTQKATVNIINDTLIIKGKVQTFDTSSKVLEVLPYASVIIKGTKIGVACDKFGEFNLRYVPNCDTGQIHIVISAIFVERKEISIALNNQKEIDLGLITMNKNEVEFTPFYVSRKKRSWFSEFWRKITFHK